MFVHRYRNVYHDVMECPMLTEWPPKVVASRFRLAESWLLDVGDDDEVSDVVL